MVFYLPPDCGEKLTLSITNLLALVVFQQMISETMPPSGDDAPILGNQVLSMHSLSKQKYRLGLFKCFDFYK